MRCFKTLILILFICFVQKPLLAQQPRIVSDFERGSIGSLKQVAPGKFKGQTMHWIKEDRIGNQYYWFYFQITDVKDKTIEFELDNLVGVYRGNTHILYTPYTQPVLSYDGEHWERVTAIKYDEETKTFNFKVTFDQEKAWLAYAHPYTYSQLMGYVAKSLDHPDVRLIAEGRSSENRIIPVLEVTDQAFSGPKKEVLIMAMQHPGEDCGSYLVEGMMDYLLSEEASAIRKATVFHFIPMMNPDGMFHGTSRYNARMQDLNASWELQPDDPKTPAEVVFVKEWLDQRKGKPDFYMDIHSHSQQRTEHVFLERGEDFKQLVDNFNPKWQLRYSRDRFTGGSTSLMHNSYGIPSATLELSQSYIGDGHYMTIVDYKEMGKEFVKNIHENLTK